MKILSVIETMNFEHGGPPEVLRNQIVNINSKKKIIYVLKLKLLSYFYLFKILFIKSYRLKFYLGQRLGVELRHNHALASFCCS